MSNTYEGDRVNNLRAWVRYGIWLLPVSGVLALLATITHQPDPATQFEEWSRYVTTDTFLISHIFGSILGAALTILAFTALAVFLSVTKRPGLAAAGLITSVLGNILVTAVFGVAAAAQTALGRAFLAGNASAEDIYNDLYTPAIAAIAGVGTLFYSLSFLFLGWSAAASKRLPKAAAIGFAIAGPLFGIFGVFVGVLQTVGAAIMIVTGVIIARAVAQQAESIEQ